MTLAENATSAPVDSPEARRYNRTRRWLEISEFVVGFAFLVLLLITGWSGTLRDFAKSLGFQNYAISIFLYVLLLLAISKVLGIGLDYYGFRLERRFKLANQNLRAWIWDEVKGFLVALVLGSIVIELLYFTIRQWPQHWWMLAWALFMILFVILAQLAPVVLLPIFYKFEPLDNEDSLRRLAVLNARASTADAAPYRWNSPENTKRTTPRLPDFGST